MLFLDLLLVTYKIHILIMTYYLKNIQVSIFITGTLVMLLLILLILSYKIHIITYLLCEIYRFQFLSLIMLLLSYKIHIIMTYYLRNIQLSVFITETW